MTVQVTTWAQKGEHTNAELEQEVDTDIDAFEKYFCEELKNDSLAKSERAILKTYLYFKTVMQSQREHEQDPNHLESSER